MEKKRANRKRKLNEGVNENEDSGKLTKIIDNIDSEHVNRIGKLYFSL